MNQTVNQHDKYNLALQDIKKELKRCPFCGSTAHCSQYSGGSGNYGSYTLATIACDNDNCGIVLKGKDVTWAGLDERIQAYRALSNKWNTRSIR